MKAAPVWFGPSERPLFGWFHSPDDGRARAAAVLCPPFSREHLQAHYALRLAAEQLADQDVAVLRFDYDGTGDSAGDNDDPDRVGAWLRSIAAAVAFVRATGIDRVALLGVRMGATLAAHAAAADGDIDQLVLWDPCASGKTFLREEQAISTLTLGVPRSRPDGGIETPGLVYGADVVRDLKAVRLDALDGPVARRVLVLTRPDRPVDQAVTDRMGREPVEYQEAVGQAALMDVGPPFQKLPYDTIDQVVDWIGKGAGDASVPVAEVEASGAVTVGYDPQGRAIVERPYFVGPAGLFGILTEVPEAPAGSPVALYLTAGNDHHIGPNRLWVELARRWAGHGIPGLRLDLSGLGDSPVRTPTQRRFITRPPESFEDVTDAARAVSPDDPHRVILVGLCASGYQAIDSGLDLRPAGVVALNPVLSFIPAELEWGQPIDPRRKAALPRTAVIGAFHDKGRLSVLRRRFPNLGWWLRMRAQPERRPATWLRDLIGGGTELLFVAGEREGRPIRLGASRRLRARLARHGKFRFVYIPELEHGLLVADQRQVVADLVTEHVAQRFGPQS